MSQHHTTAARTATTPRRTLLALALASFAGAACAANATPGNVANHPMLIASQVPAAVTSGTARFVRKLPATQRMKLAINLPLRDEAGLHAFIADVYNPASPNYRHFLGVDEFTARFGPTQADYDAVVAWARAQGFAVTRTTRNRHIVDIEGSVETVENALHVSMNAYDDPARQRGFHSPDREPTLNLSVPILQITGLDDYQPPRPLLKKGDATSQLGPIGHAGGSGPSGVYLPSDMRAAYYGNGPLTGAGQSVGIFSFDGYKPADVQVFYDRTGMTSNVPINDVRVNGFSGLCGDGGDGCDDGEQILDIVNVIGMAPGITQILFYEGDSGPDILNEMATDDIAKEISCSWGSGDMGHVNDPTFMEFQAQGQTFANATGDDGSYNANSWLPPSLNAYTLQVGGTHLTTSTPGGPWSGESAWSDSGGGYYAPAGYDIPDWQAQSGVINASNHGSTTLRNDPDVSAEADYDNPTVSNGQYEAGFGGTSFAAPRWAGYIALANEQAAANGSGPLGFVNPSLYGLGVGANYADNFHDPASGSNGGFSAVAGYDLVTGWGSPNAALIGSLSGSATAPGFVLAPYPLNAYVVPGETADVDIDVAAINGFADTVDLAVTGGLPSGVTASFSPSSTTAHSVLTLSAAAGTSVGPATLTITGTGNPGGTVRSASISLLVGNPPSAVADASVDYGNVVVLGKQSRSLSLANAENSVPLTYTANAYASSDGSCSGAVAWLTVPMPTGTVAGGHAGSIGLTAQPPAANLAVGSYAAEVCIATNDPTQAQIVIPVTMNVVPGPAAYDGIFRSGFESGETQPSANLYTFVIDQPVEDSQAGSALDLATGNYHEWNLADIDNINLYDDSTGLQVYWYNDELPGSVRNRVGGVTSGGKYAVLARGATIGPSSTFNRTISALTNWQSGADGYLGIAFYNSQTHVLNYGYIHLVSTGPSGFPAQVLDYGFDDTGAAVTIP